MEQNEGRCAIDLESVWVSVSSVPTKISNSSGTNPFPVLINRRSPSHLTTGPHAFGCFPSLCFWFISFHYSCPLPDLLPPTGGVSLLLFCWASTLPPFVSICVGWARRSMPLSAEADRLPLVPPNLHLSAGVLQLAAEWKPFSPRTIQNKRWHFSADEGGVMKFQGDFKISFIVVNVCWLFQENEIWIILIPCHEWTGNILSSFVLFNNLWKSTSL